MSVIEHVTSLEQLVTIEEMDLDERGERLADLMAENAKLREFASKAFSSAFNFYHGVGTAEDLRKLKVEYRELGIEGER